VCVCLCVVFLVGGSKQQREQAVLPGRGLMWLELRQGQMERADSLFHTVKANGSSSVTLSVTMSFHLNDLRGVCRVGHVWEQRKERADSARATSEAYFFQSTAIKQSGRVSVKG
jgi:hypothetical protein